MSEQKKNEEEFLNALFEWAVWGHLDSEKNIEMILLKGHLLLEVSLETALKRNSIIFDDDYSFFRKINLFNFHIKNSDNKDEITNFLHKINNLRNELAHEFFVNTLEEDLKALSEQILTKLNGTKYTKYTFRTKIVHSFSTLAINILEIKNCG